MSDHNHSNVQVVSNVYLRDANLVDVRSDENYNSKIRGRESIRIMLNRIYGYEVRIDEVDHLRLAWLTQEQKEQFKGMRCPLCQRLDYGWIDDRNGNRRWGHKTCICQDGTENR